MCGSFTAKSRRENVSRIHRQCDVIRESGKPMKALCIRVCVVIRQRKSSQLLCFVNEIGACVGYGLRRSWIVKLWKKIFTVQLGVSAHHQLRARLGAVF